MDTTPHVITALLALGMALAFIIADRSSPTSRALALFLTFVGVSIVITTRIEVPYVREHGGVPAWGGIFALPEVLSFVFAYEWVLRVRRTVPARNLKTRGPDMLLRIAQGLALFFFLASLAFPKIPFSQFIGAGRRPGVFRGGPEV